MDQKTAPSGPEAIFGMLNAYQQTAALKAAFELDLFTAIAEGARTANKLAERCGASERGVRILSDFLVVHGLLSKDGEGYGLNPTSAAFLDRRSPAYLGSVAQFLASSEMMEGFRDLTAVVRKGGPVLEHGVLETENPIWVNFARSMVPLMLPPAQEISALIGAGTGQNWKVLDIAAGHGMFGITIARANPNAEIVAQDWRNILAVAQENADAAQLGPRFHTLPGSAFEVDFGTGYDIVLLTNFLHHFDKAACEQLLRKVHAALKTGGLAVTLEFVPNEDRVSPSVPAAFSMVMLGNTPSGDAYTFSELRTMFQRAGFARSDLHALNASPEHVMLSYKTLPGK